MLILSFDSFSYIYEERPTLSFFNYVLLYFGSADQEAGEDAITDDTTYSDIKIAQEPQQPVREARGSIVFVCLLIPL